jgi:phosphate-transporting ATPase
MAIMQGLVVEGISRPGLEPASFAVGCGRCLCVRGASGSGKTLLLRAIADLDPNQGTVTLDGIHRDSLTGPAWRRRVVYLAAEPGWWADTVSDHFEDWGSLVPQAAALLLPAGIGEAPVTRLSTGERQRLAVLRAIERKPAVLLLDEPTASLDTTARDAVEVLLAEERKRGAILVWVSHDAGQAARVGDAFVSVAAGKVTP